MHRTNELDSLGDDEPETHLPPQQVGPMQLIHAGRALRAVTTREIVKFVQQRGRLLSALVRPLMWLAVFAAGFQNVFGVSIIPPYKTYITYQVYIVPGLLGIILLFHGMQSSLSMVYDREMGVMRLLLTAPLPRWVLLGLQARRRNRALGDHLLRVPGGLHPVRRDLRLERLAHRAAGAHPVRADAGIALAVPLGPYQAGGEFRRRHELRDVPDVLLLLGALSAVEAARGRLRMALLDLHGQPVHPCGRDDPLYALRHVRPGLGPGGRRARRWCSFCWR